MDYVLVRQPDADDVYMTPANEGYSYAHVACLEARDGDTHEVLDTSELSDDERYEIYISRAIAAAGTRYRVGRIFGSNRFPGQDFGWRVPALLVYAEQNDTHPADVHPHEHRDGRSVTIAEHLAAT